MGEEEEKEKGKKRRKTSWEFNTIIVPLLVALFIGAIAEVHIMTRSIINTQGEQTRMMIDNQEKKLVKVEFAIKEVLGRVSKDKDDLNELYKKYTKASEDTERTHSLKFIGGSGCNASVLNEIIEKVRKESELAGIKYKIYVDHDIGFQMCNEQSVLGKEAIIKIDDSKEAKQDQCESKPFEKYMGGKR